MKCFIGVFVASAIAAGIVVWYGIKQEIPNIEHYNQFVHDQQ